ncbi:hypothetical protein [Oceanicoccus sagamiensis]|uniref:Uncharacterized protein n=1 Tax=Oceanicoccus sagamiensis TaxID=716816 RepID=A0A1X9N816_9GAMM|nr:hypothetical protein [Oceanicoccus sagamiensis]ARN73826.1 hypothetical protein BST96_06685 [Oceanicoccus sagamiensis]
MQHTENQYFDEAAIRVLYERAESLEKGILNEKLALNATIYPHWIKGDNAFWYVRKTAAGTM